MEVNIHSCHQAPSDLYSSVSPQICCLLAQVPGLQEVGIRFIRSEEVGIDLRLGRLSQSVEGAEGAKGVEGPLNRNRTRD